MNKLLKVPIRVIGYKLHRTFGWPKILPLSLTISVTNLCASKCKTCHMWHPTSSEKELTIEEWGKIFKSFGKSVTWLTFSGGNQFLRKDFHEIVNKTVDLTNPFLINIPLSNSDVEGTIKQIIKILEPRKTNVIINISLDGSKEKHDLIRGIKGNFENTIEIFHRLKKLKEKFPKLSVCFNTVISKHNFNSLDEIHKIILDLKPDYWTLEPFQARAEFKNLGIKPELDYKKLFLKIKHFSSEKKMVTKKVLKTKNIMRNVYYFFAEKTIIEQTAFLPCYAGISSAHISPEGDVLQCGTKYTSIGNLRDSNYDFKKIFFSKKADKIRKEIKEKKCFCIQCNNFYTNLICNPKSFIKYFIRSKD